MRKLTFSVVLTALTLGCFAQKQILDWDDILKWNRVTDHSISPNGDYISVESNPWQGDGKLTIYNSKGGEITSFDRSGNSQFVGDNGVVVVMTPSQLLTDSLKLKKVKGDKMPQKSLVYYDLSKGASQSIDSLVDFKGSDKNPQWLVYRAGKSKELVITDFNNKNSHFRDVVDYQFSKEEGFLIFNRYIKDSISKVMLFDLKKGVVAEEVDVPEIGESVALSVNEDGRAAFVVKGKDLSGKENKAFYWSGKSLTQIPTTDIEEGWIVNENERPSFAKSSERLFFGVSPAYPVDDTTILESYKAKVEVWVGDEPKLHTQQVVDRQRDIKYAYKAMYLPKSNSVMQLGDAENKKVTLSQDGDGDYALLEASDKYGVESMWTGSTRADISLKSLKDGSVSELYEGLDARISFSPEGNYLQWYCRADSSWYVYSIAEKLERKVASPDQVKAYDASGNVPALPYNFGSAGWLEGDETFYIYDKYDIWALDPKGVAEPKLITDGYKTSTTYRVLGFEQVVDRRFGKDDASFEKDEKLFLSLFDNISKQSGYAEYTLGGKSGVKQLVKGEYRYGDPIKGADSDVIIFTRENFSDFPNLYVSDLSFKSGEKRFTDLNPQQDEFNWGSVEPISWVSLDGDTLHGNLYKPENFDPNKKYPMICNFYERDSDNRYAHKVPETHRSTIDYHYYTSNGYVIFNPDIKYLDGYPGQSCYNSLMPGISKILEMGFVDPKRIGAQGHSWGGYQVAYLATRTNLFAAIESGAPVVNMVSAYGGIRWATGLNRAFQYEQGQSRIGASPWEAPLLYTENSPIYTMDKVETPILIMHNDGDGHVPWWQGIEYFIALRRLEKPVWLLNYNGEPHWPLKLANKIDFQTRMSQFFGYYLKGEEKPEWM